MLCFKMRNKRLFMEYMIICLSISLYYLEASKQVFSLLKSLQQWFIYSFVNYLEDASNLIKEKEMNHSNKWFYIIKITTFSKEKIYFLPLWKFKYLTYCLVTSLQVSSYGFCQKMTGKSPLLTSTGMCTTLRWYLSS